MPDVPLRRQERAQVSLKIAARRERGKGPVGQLRRAQGQLPGILYGHKQHPYPFKTDAHALDQVLKKGGQNAIILVEHEEEGQEPERAIIREVQYHKVRGNPLHLDLLRISADEKLRAEVPLITEGVPEGVRIGGGALQQTMTSVEMECVVSEMPSALVIDIRSLVIGDSLHVSDLLEQEPRITTDPARTIVNVLAPRLAAVEAVEAEGEEGGEAEAGEGAGEGEEAPQE